MTTALQNSPLDYFSPWRGSSAYGISAAGYGYPQAAIVAGPQGLAGYGPQGAIVAGQYGAVVAPSYGLDVGATYTAVGGGCGSCGAQLLSNASSGNCGVVAAAPAPCNTCPPPSSSVTYHHKYNKKSQVVTWVDHTVEPRASPHTAETFETQLPTIDYGCSSSGLVQSAAPSCGAGGATIIAAPY